MESSRLTLGQARELLGRVTYKKGWTFRLESDYDIFIVPSYFFQEDVAYLYIEYTAPDRNSPNKTTRVVGVTSIPIGHINETMFMRYVWDAILKSETHEVMEFLRIDGAIHWDPHNKKDVQHEIPDFTKPLPQK